MADPREAEATAVDDNNVDRNNGKGLAPEPEPLFLRTIQAPEPDQSKRKAEPLGSENRLEFPVNISDATKKGAGGEESLFTGLMNDPKARKDFTQLGKSPKIGGGSEADKMLAGFDVVDEKFPKAAGLRSKELNNDLKNTLGLIKGSANNSAEAALVDLSNNLADHKDLLPKITDSQGKITSKSIEGALRADISEEGSGNGRLSSEQRETLLKALSALNKANEFKMPDGKTLQQKGFSRDLLNGMSTPELKDRLKESPGGDIDPNHPEELMPPALSQGTSGSDNAGKRDSDVSINGSDSSIKAPPGSKADRKPVEQLAPGEFTTVGKTVLEKLDTEKTGKVTKEQLAKALEDPSFTGKEAQALAALYRNFDKLKDLSGEQRFYEFKGINAADLDKFAEIETAQNKRTAQEAETYRWAQSNLSKFSNGTGSLKQSDIEKALSDPSTSQDDRKQLQRLQQTFSEYKKDTQGGINMDSIGKHYDRSFSDTFEAKVVSGVWGSAYRTNQSQQPDISRDLYATPESPLKSITPEAIKQGFIGNCYFEAALGSVAQANPESIKNMIKDNGDGTYTVTFPGAPNEPITVKAPTEAEQGMYNQGSPHGLWASVMEKAFGKYRDNHNWISSHTAQEGADGGGYTSEAMKLLTGKEVESTHIKSKPEEIAKQLQEAFSSNPQKEVAASINGDSKWAEWWGTATERTDDKFIKGHAYSITGFTPNGKDGGSVTIRNPHANGAGPDGTITIPLEQFIKNFDFLHKGK